MRVFEAAAWRCVELTREQVPLLQGFFEANPEYHLAVNGEPPGPGEALEEYESLPPNGWPFDRKWVLACVDREDEMIAMVDVLSNLFAPGIWHVGTFIVATHLHGSGVANDLYDSLEGWMRASGARWSRLGVVAGNGRAERFWERAGYRELRRREAVPMGRRLNTIRVMAKPLAPGDWSEYFAKVARDRPEAA